MSSPIPVTIVTGFLGSGKTTLLLNLLPQLRAANPSYRLALLKNEFGDVAVDSQLASSSAISGVQELLNGCICCNQVGQLSESLRELASTINPDRIVIETSGSAFPATLAIEINRVSRETGGHFALDGVVSVIDVENWAGYEDTSYTARIQAKYTDLIVFNKWELCDERRFDEVLDRVGDLEVDIAWVKSDKGRVPVDVVFGIDGGLAQSLVEEEKKEQDVHDHGHGHEHKHDHQAEVEVLSVTLKSSTTTTTTSQAATIDSAKLLKLLKTAPKDEIYRIKAVLAAPAGSVASSEDQPAPPPPAPTSPSSQDALASSKSNNSNNQRYILNWAFGRWTFTPLAATTEIKEHDSSQAHPLRMTLILARYESTKWKKKLETGGFLELQDAAGGGSGAGGGELTVTKIV